MKNGIYGNSPTAAGLGGRSQARSPPPAAAEAEAGEAFLPPSRPRALLPAQLFPGTVGIPPARQRLSPGRETRPGGERDGAQWDAPGLHRRGVEGAGSESLSPGTLQRDAGASDRCSPLVPGAERSSRGRRAATSTTKRAAEPSQPPLALLPSGLQRAGSVGEEDMQK